MYWFILQWYIWHSNTNIIIIIIIIVDGLVFKCFLFITVLLFTDLISDITSLSTFSYRLWLLLLLVVVVVLDVLLLLLLLSLLQFIYK